MNDSYERKKREDPRDSESFKAGIPVLLQKKSKKSTYECTLMNISKIGFVIRFEKNKFNFILDEEFYLLIDPELFQMESETILKLNSFCKKINPDKLELGALFDFQSLEQEQGIEKIVNCFRNLSEYEI